jgi:light-regulated signal transduction histidine kinase (bacteriophytochrome)
VVLADASAQVVERGAAVTVTSRPGAVVSADPAQLRSVLHRLLTHAAGAGSARGAEIAVAATSESAVVEVSWAEVLDERAYRRLLLPFAPEGRPPGLALAAAAGLARLGGGELTVGSGPAGRSTFALTVRRHQREI